MSRICYISTVLIPLLSYHHIACSAAYADGATSAQDYLSLAALPASGFDSFYDQLPPLVELIEESNMQEIPDQRFSAHVHPEHTKRVPSHKRPRIRNKLPCHQCGYIASTASNLMVHKRRHASEKPNKCPHCNKSFIISSALARHIRVHTGEKPYRCANEHCTKSYADKSSLKEHEQRVHNIKTTKRRRTQHPLAEFDATAAHAVAATAQLHELLPAPESMHSS